MSQKSKMHYNALTGIISLSGGADIFRLTGFMAPVINGQDMASWSGW